MTIWTNLVETHPRHIPTKFQVNLANGFWEEVENVNCWRRTDAGRRRRRRRRRRRTEDHKISSADWQVSWANNLASQNAKIKNLAESKTLAPPPSYEMVPPLPARKIVGQWSVHVACQDIKMVKPRVCYYPVITLVGRYVIFFFLCEGGGIYLACNFQVFSFIFSTFLHLNFTVYYRFLLKLFHFLSVFFSQINLFTTDVSLLHFFIFICFVATMAWPLHLLHYRFSV